jgi:hypothetical protein
MSKRPGQELPREAREGLMRAWLDILRERHPGVEWVAAEPRPKRKNRPDERRLRG